MKRQIRFYFIFAIAIFYTFLYCLTAVGAAGGLRDELRIVAITTPHQLPNTTAFYRNQGYALDEGKAWDNWQKAQEINLKYHCLTASLPGQEKPVGALEWSVYPRAFDGAPRADLKILVAEIEQGEAVAEHLFYLGTALSAQYQHTLPDDMGSKIRVSLNIPSENEGKVVSRGIAKFKASANTPYGFHASLATLETNFPSTTPARDDISFVPVTNIGDLAKGYSVFHQLQPKLTESEYTAGFNIGGSKLTILHAVRPDAPEKVVGIMAGAYVANLAGIAFDPDTIVVDASERGHGIGKEALRKAVDCCKAKSCSIFVESGKARGVSDFYEERGIPADSINYRWDLPDLTSILTEPVISWTDATLHSLGIA